MIPFLKTCKNIYLSILIIIYIYLFYFFAKKMSSLTVVAKFIPDVVWYFVKVMNAEKS